jgi:hypothetical protein
VKSMRQVVRFSSPLSDLIFFNILSRFEYILHTFHPCLTYSPNNKFLCICYNHHGSRNIWVFKVQYLICLTLWMVILSSLI